MQHDEPPVPAPPEDEEFSLTNQPFGATEQVVSHVGHKAGPRKSDVQDDVPELQEVEPFDLNAPAEGKTPRKDKVKGRAAATPSSYLPKDSPAREDKNSASSNPPEASSMILSGDLADKSMLKGPEEDDTAGEDLKRTPSVKPADPESLPPNPLEARTGESTKLPIRNHRISNADRDDHNELDLPKVKKGDGDGPQVLYGKDIVLDMGGYHKDPKSMNVEPEAMDGPNSLSSEPAPEADLDTQAEPMNAMAIKDVHVEELVNDLMASVSAPPKRRRDLTSAMGAMSLDDSDNRPSSPSARRAFDRAKSEPLDQDSRPSSPNGDRIDNKQMDLAWDWAGPAEEEGHHRPEAHRGDSLPVDNEHGQDPGLQTLRAQLTHVEDDPYTFMLQLDGRVHLFELSLCGTDGYAVDGKANVSLL